MRRRLAILGTLSILALTFCSLRDLDYLRDPLCAPHCGSEAGSDAPVADAPVPSADASEASAPEPCDAGAGYRALVLCDRPAAYWRLGDPGPPAAKNEVDGSTPGAYVTTVDDDAGLIYQVAGAIKGDPDTAIHFDGNGWLSAGGAFAFPSVAPYSLEAWVLPEGDNFSYRRIVERVQYDDSDGHQVDGYILYNHDTVATERYVDASTAVVSGPPIGNGAYSHVVVTYGDGTLSIYVNGSLSSSQPAPGLAAGSDATFYVGGNFRPGGGWIGAIDEVAIYAYALSADQVTVHYLAGRGP